jgi:hypothetical protein
LLKSRPGCDKSGQEWCQVIYYLSSFYPGNTQWPLFYLNPKKVFQGVFNFSNTESGLRQVSPQIQAAEHGHGTRFVHLLLMIFQYAIIINGEKDENEKNAHWGVGF